MPMSILVRYKSVFIILLLKLIIITRFAAAEVVLDDTLGAGGALTGLDYQIGAELGQQQGGNLFHSFSEFNLKDNESATFSGPSKVKNIIARVTGGNPSYINGTLRSTIPDAEVYFINPFGIFWGENAKLDVQGSFHASTADAVTLGNHGQFNARHPEQSLLAVAPPSAFGFLTDSPAAIIAQDSKLSVPAGNTLSLIGGNLYLNGTPPNEDSSTLTSGLSAAFGRLNLASVASQGEVIPAKSELKFSPELQGGTIQGNFTEIDASGEGGGDIFIRGGRLELSNSEIKGQTLGDQDGGIINIQVDELALQDNSKINARNFGSGKGNDVDIKVTDTLSILNRSSGIFGTSISEEENAGNAGHIKIQAGQIKSGGIISGAAFRADAGDISVQADDILLTGGAYLISTTIGPGRGGNIEVKATGKVTVEGASSEDGWQTGIFATTKPWRENSTGGQGGNIQLEARELLIKDGGRIDASTTTLAAQQTQSDQAGNIVIRVSGEVKLVGVNPHGENVDGFGTGIYVRSLGDRAGKAGSISLKAGSLSISDGAVITSSTTSQASGGNINIHLDDSVCISGDSANLALDEPADTQLAFREQFVDYQNPVSISGIYAHSENQGGSAGQAGDIAVSAKVINLTEGGLINTSTQNAGGGGITLTTPYLLYLREGQIITSVAGGVSDGGNITLKTPQFAVLDQGKIQAQAEEGRGGDIHIISDEFISSPDSVISASSKLGVDGKVIISSPDVDISGRVIILASDFLDATTQLKKGCQVEDVEELSKFGYAAQREGMPMTPESWQE